jgi:hypothetical protein
MKQHAGSGRSTRHRPACEDHRIGRRPAARLRVASKAAVEIVPAARPAATTAPELPDAGHRVSSGNAALHRRQHASAWRRASADEGDVPRLHASRPGPWPAGREAAARAQPVAGRAPGSAGRPPGCRGLRCCRNRAARVRLATGDRRGPSAWRDQVYRRSPPSSARGLSRRDRSSRIGARSSGRGGAGMTEDGARRRNRGARTPAQPVADHHAEKEPAAPVAAGRARARTQAACFSAPTSAPKASLVAMEASLQSSAATVAHPAPARPGAQPGIGSPHGRERAFRQCVRNRVAVPACMK